jgi:hypothetical protein
MLVLPGAVHYSNASCYPPHRTAQTTTAGHVIGEQGQQTKHKGESLMDKAAHAVGMKK